MSSFLQIRIFFYFPLVGLLIGCSQAGSATNSARLSPSISSPDATGFSTVSVTATHALNILTETQIPRLTKTPLPTDTGQPYSTPWPEGFTPTVRPTPTRGLPPTATKGPKETCPKPTGAFVAIDNLDDPAEYESSVLEYLSATGELATFAKGIVAEDNPIVSRLFFVTLFQADVNNDMMEEFILSIHKPYEAKDASYGSSGFPSRTAIYIVGCRENRYEVIHKIILDKSEIELPSGLLAVEDLNGNGIKEIVFSVVDYIGPHGDQNLSTHVLEWSGSTFRELIWVEQEHIWDFRVKDGVAEFQDLDRNGTFEIILPHRRWNGDGGVDCEFGPGRNTKTVLMWDGEYFRFMWNEPAAPRCRFQAAYDGDLYSYIGLYDEAETMYLRAVFDESLKPGSRADWKKDGQCDLADDEKPDPTEPQRIKAYARFRLVELFVRVGRVMEAESHRTYLRTYYPLGSPGYFYAYLANTFWWEYVKEEDISAACDAVRKAAGENTEEVFSVFENYGTANPGPTLENICPFTTPPAEG